MIINMGLADRRIRIVIATLFGLLYFTYIVTGTLAIVALIMAAVLLLTSVIGYCPLYSPFGISTCRNKSRT